MNINFTYAVDQFKSRGSIGFTKRIQNEKEQIVPFLTYASTDRSAVEKFVEGFEIKTQIHTKVREGRKDLYHINYASGKKILSILQKVYPYIIGTPRQRDIDDFISHYEQRWEILLQRPTITPENNSW